MVDIENIKLFLGSLLLNECPCIHIASLMFERNILLRLQNVSKYHVYKMSQNRGFWNYQRGGNLKKKKVNFERGRGSVFLGNYADCLFNRVFFIMTKDKGVRGYL